MPTVFFAFRDAPERRSALRSPDALDRYRLFGLDETESAKQVPAGRLPGPQVVLRVRSGSVDGRIRCL